MINKHTSGSMGAVHKFVDEIDPYKKVLWKKNILETPRICLEEKEDEVFRGDLFEVYLKDVDDVEERSALLIRKIEWCTPVLDFSAPTNLLRKKIKKVLLSEILGYLVHLRDISNPLVFNKLFTLVETNTMRLLPESVATIDFFEQHFAYELSRPHLLLVYEILRELLGQEDFSKTAYRERLDEAFVDRLMDLFNSKDVMEWRMLRTILVQIYHSFPLLRFHVRSNLYAVCSKYALQDIYTNGLPALLQLYVSILPGFVVPILNEHRVFFSEIFLKLHSTHMYPAYYKPYTDCLYEMLILDSKLFDLLLNEMLRYWPMTNSHKEVLFLRELDDLLRDVSKEMFEVLMTPLFTQVVKCLMSAHYEVAESALDLLQNAKLCPLIDLYASSIVPSLLPAIEYLSTCVGHPLKSKVTLIFNRYKPLVSRLGAVVGGPEERKRQLVRKLNWEKIDLLEKELRPNIRHIPSESKLGAPNDEDMTLLLITTRHPFTIFPSNPSSPFHKKAIDMMINDPEVVKRKGEDGDGPEIKEEEKSILKELSIKRSNLKDLKKVEPSSHLEVNDVDIIEPKRQSSGTIVEVKESKSSWVLISKVPSLYELALWEMTPHVRLSKSVNISDPSILSEDRSSVYSQSNTSLIHMSRNNSEVPSIVPSTPSYIETQRQQH